MSLPIQIVTLDNLHESIQNQQARAFFSEMLRVRAQGYGPPDYPKHILPYDLSDFVSWHHLFCIRNEGKLIPIGGFKQISLERCDTYHVTLPLLAIAKAAEAPLHIQVLEDLINSFRTEKKPLIYGGSWTVEKQYRRDPQLASLLRELTAALVYMDSIERNIPDSVAMGALRFKTDRFFESVGFERIKHNDSVLPPIGIKHASNEQIVLIQLEQFSEWAKACFEKHAFLLRTRLVISSEQAIEQEVQKAA